MRSRQGIDGYRRGLLNVVGALGIAALWLGCGGDRPSSPTAPSPMLANLVISVPVTVLTVGQSVQARATNGTVDVTAMASWVSSDPSIVSVSNAGLVTGLHTGSADITANTLDRSGRLHLNVTDEPGRVSTNRPDQLAGYQVQFLYVLPSDRQDERLDVNGTIRVSVGAIQQWLTREGGLRLRVDTSDGQLDIPFVRLPGSDMEYASAGALVRDRIEAALASLGFNDSRKIYGVYYGGASYVSCGSGPIPPRLVGTVAAVYLKGVPVGGPPCDSNPFAPTPEAPGYIEFIMAHEIMHALGVVGSCAPHNTDHSHVPEPSDLMYAGSLPWRPSTLDVGRDDYFAGGNGSTCLDVADSVFVTPTRAGARLPPGW